MNQQQLKSLFMSMLVLIISGCAINTDDDKVFISEKIQTITEQSLSQPLTRTEQEIAAARVRQLLSQPLSLDQAVEIAILNSPAIQAELWSLGIAQADLQQLSLIPNPGVKISRDIGSDGSTELEFGFNLLALITLPKVRDIARQEFEVKRLATAQRISSLIHNTKVDYWQAVAASEVLTYLEKVQPGTEATAELAKRMAATGNFNKLQFLREQSFLSDSTLQLALARQAHMSSLQKLRRQLGLWQHSLPLILPERLPQVPAIQPPVAEIAQQSLSNRLDIQLATMQLSKLAAELQLTKATRLVNVFEGEISGNLDDSSERSYSLIFELPLFDAGQYRLNQQQARYQQAFAEASAVGVNARAELQQSLYNYQIHYDIAVHYQHTVLPIAQQIAEENQLLYNGMFISVFELLADARSQISAVTRAIEANRDYWVAKAELEMAQIGTPDSNFPTQLSKPSSAPAAKKKAGH